MQDGIHIATKFRNRLLSETAHMKIGSYSIDIQDVFDLIDFEIIKKKLPVDSLNTFAFNSQICENTFRIARSLSGSFSSNTNFSVKSFLKQCEKISIINSIKSRGGQIGDYQFYFPQHHKNHKETYNYPKDHINELNLTEIDIEIIIKNAFEEAKKYVSMVNMTEFLKTKISIPYQA
ncbi:unnamed protein product [Rotaria magnacalcarata]|uniref:Uncharacterized protein n=1 Tax=Rotaria magnacalcarata TaxID=392030 RepID=A0A816X3X7_9BILA|nr:unnamed protein product [Rotaria magnacalcarata]